MFTRMQPLRIDPRNETVYVLLSYDAVYFEKNTNVSEEYKADIFMV